MSTILQDMMGMLWRKQQVAPKTDDYITIARYQNPQERMKPQPKVQTELVTMGSIKTFVNAGNSDSQQLSIAGQVLSLTNGGSVTIPSGVPAGDLEVTGALDLTTVLEGVIFTASDSSRWKQTISPTGVPVYTQVQVATKKKSTVNSSGNYTKPGMRKRLFNSIKAGSKGGGAGQWSARKAQMLAKRYKANGGGYKTKK